MDGSCLLKSCPSASRKLSQGSIVGITDGSYCNKTDERLIVNSATYKEYERTMFKSVILVLNRRDMSIAGAASWIELKPAFKF